MTESDPERHDGPGGGSGRENGDVRRADGGTENHSDEPTSGTNRTADPDPDSDPDADDELSDARAE
jgi:hypothetical protein